MRQWEIWDFPFPTAGQPHGFVIISNQEVCGRARFLAVNGLICTTLQGNRQPLNYEVILDQQDGLDYRTVVACNFIFALPKKDSLRTIKRGTVAVERRRAIAKTIPFSFEFNSVF